VTGFSALLAKAIAAAASLTGKKFALMVASSLVATTGVLAAGMSSSSSNLAPLAALLGRNVAVNQAPAPVAEEPEEEVEVEEAGGEPEPVTSEAEPAPESSPETPSEPEEPSEEPEEEAPPPEEESIPGPIQHVFVVNLASSGYEAAFGTTPQMPYLAGTLRPQGSLLSNYTLLDEATSANSIAAVSGQRPNAATEANCPTNDNFPPSATANRSGFVSGDGCIYPVATLSLGDQLSSDQLKWKAYMESMVDPTTGAPANCVYPEPGTAETPVTGGYSVTLNPFTRFHSLLDLGDCSAIDVPLTELDKDLKKTETTPNFTYISPNLCNAGVAGQCPAGAPQGAAAADAFLSLVAPKILKSAAFKKDGLLIVSFDQVSPPAVDPTTGLAAPPAAEPLKVGALLISRYASPGSTDATPYDPYSMLRSVEDLFQLSHLAGAAPSKVHSFASALLGENGGD
jgi:hypothetical protein